MNSPKNFETLDTSFVSLAALIRYLREQKFNGRLHLSLQDYESDVFLYGEEQPSVWEKDLTTGREARGDDALQRLLVRAREPGGVITVYEGLTGTSNPAQASDAANVDQGKVEDLTDANLIEASAELINAVERAVQSTGIEFAEEFRIARIGIGDDYPFLDPTLGGFEYTNCNVVVQTIPSERSYVRALTECLRGVVDRVAAKTDETRFRERVAVELAISARRNEKALGSFVEQLDRIAGTRVL